MIRILNKVDRMITMNNGKKVELLISYCASIFYTKENNSKTGRTAKTINKALKAKISQEICKTVPSCLQVIRSK